MTILTKVWFSVSKVTGYVLDDRGSIAGTAETTLFLPSCLGQIWDPSTCYAIDTGGKAVEA